VGRITLKMAEGYCAGRSNVTWCNQRAGKGGKKKRKGRKRQGQGARTRMKAKIKSRGHGKRAVKSKVGSKDDDWWSDNEGGTV